MGFTGKFLDFFTDLFIKLHWVAVLYAVLASGIAAGIGAYFIGPFFILVVLAPVGPLSLVSYGLLPILLLFFSSPWYPEYALLYRLSVIVVFAALKALIYLAVRRNRVHGVSAALLLLAYFSLLLLVEAVVLLALPGLIPEPVPEKLVLGLSIALLLSFPMDLVVFSYVKFRDAVKGVEPRKWIPILVALWTAMPWLVIAIIVIITVILNHEMPKISWTSPSDLIPIYAETAITALQLLYIALYIHSRGIVTLEAGALGENRSTGH